MWVQGNDHMENQMRISVWFHTKTPKSKNPENLPRSLLHEQKHLNLAEKMIESNVFLPLGSDTTCLPKFNKKQEGIIKKSTRTMKNAWFIIERSQSTYKHTHKKFLNRLSYLTHIPYTSIYRVHIQWSPFSNSSPISHIKYYNYAQNDFIKLSNIRTFWS